MIVKYFKCTLESDLVINASLATEGNMKTLNYIPGSNFLGIVAKQLYPRLKAAGKGDDAYHIFHSGQVSFGDAHISVDGSRSYAMPFSLFKDKLNKEVAGPEANLWLRHLLNDCNRPKDNQGNLRQLKQHRGGYLTPTNKYIGNVKKRFALKSAQERKTRKSKDEAMFGFESIPRGKEFIFSVQFEDEKYVEEVCEALKGDQRVGKSKSAQFGQVKIESIEMLPPGFLNGKTDEKQLVIYAESNWCLLNEFGQSTFLPGLKDFNLGGKGEINWTASSIRTYSYSPWNNHRKTCDTQRDCILKGSVIVVDLESTIDINTLSDRIGHFQSEGLGRVLYNPVFFGRRQD